MVTSTASGLREGRGSELPSNRGERCSSRFSPFLRVCWRGSYGGYWRAGAALAELPDFFDLPVKKEIIFCQIVGGGVCCGADRVSARSPRSFERRRPPRRRRSERCVSFSFIAGYEVLSFCRMGGALEGTTDESRPAGTGR